MDQTAQATPGLAAAPSAAEMGHYEQLYGGLDKVKDNLSAENRDQLDLLTANAEDPQEAQARMVNQAYIRARNPQIDEDALTQNWEAAKVAYAKQVLGVDKPAVSDKELYTGIAGRFQRDRDERTLLNEGLGRMFDTFRKGTPDWRQAFTATLAEMKGKPGYSPDRLDVYRQLAKSQWDHWEGTGQHYPAAVDAVATYFQSHAENRQDEQTQMTAREAALHALGTVPPDQQDAIIGLAMRQKSATPEDAGFAEKLAGRLESGIGDFARGAALGFKDLLTRAYTPGAALLPADDSATRKTERKLDAAVAGGVDPYQGGNWLSEGVLGAAEASPRMLAMFNPAGIAANVLAFSDEAAGHFEDAGVDPVKARGLGLVASIPLTALQMVSSKTVVGSRLTSAGEAWLLRNITDKTGAALAKGYAKNILAQGVENTALLGTVTAAQQLTEPAVQTLGNMLDGTIPGVQWTGKDGELARLAGATPQSLATLVPLIALGVGVGTLRTRGAALEARTVQNRPALEALGLKPEAVEQVMAAHTPEDAVNVLQTNFKDRTPNPAAMEALNRQTPAETPEAAQPASPKVTLAPDGGYLVKNEAGNPVAQTNSAEAAAQAAGEHTAQAQQPVQLGDPTDPLAELPAGKKSRTEASQDLGFVPGNGKLANVINSGLITARRLIHEVTTLPQFKGFHQVLNKWVGDTQLGIMHTTADVKKVLDAVPDSLTRRAIARWIDAGGDQATLEAMAKDSTMEAAKKEYLAALKLTPEQIKVAESIREWFAHRAQRAVDAGVMSEGNLRQNYMTQIIERPFVQGGDNSKFSGNLNKNFKFSQERTFPNFAELEKAGFTAKTTDVAEIMARYDTALNKAIMSRQLVRDLLEAKNEAGEPLAVPLKGSLRPGEGDQPNFISNPRQVMVDEAQGKIDQLTKQIADLHDQLEKGTGQSRFDIADEIKDLREQVKELRAEQNPEDAKLYKSIDHPALRKFWWMGKDPTTGKDTFIEGDIGLHPDIKTHLENALGTSGLRRWYDSSGNVLTAIPKVVVKAIDESNGFLKRNLLGGLSLFHAVHEYKRAAGNRVFANPFNLPDIDPKDPKVQMQVRTGLMLATPHDVTNLYSEGLGNGSLVDKIPGLGKLSKGVSEYTFHKLIPALKSQVWNHVYARNLETFKDAIAKGEATKEQIAYLTSNQMNARFGHQNLADLGRNPTFQHILQIATLAPDFWESNARNYGQDIQGLIGAKNGREPAIAFATTAATLWLASRVLNKALDDDWHFEEPFAVVSDGRVYTMRNEVEDLVRLWNNARGYVMGRLSPTAQAFEEWRSGTNWRGEKITTAEVFKNWIAKVFPMSLRFLPGVKNATDALETGGGRTVSVFQQFLGSLGVQVGRHSPLSEAYQLANEWRKKQGEKEDRGTYPVSKYQQLRYAIEDNDIPRAIEEAAKLRKPGEPPYKLWRGFEASVMHPWTGSREKDIEFMDSLTPEDRAIIEKANAHREKILERAKAILQSDDPSTTNP